MPRVIPSAFLNFGATGFISPLLTLHFWSGVWWRKTLRAGLQNPSSYRLSLGIPELLVVETKSYA